MPNASYAQSSFLGGEWSQAAQGDTTRQDYRTAMNACVNGLAFEEGAWGRRSGSRILGRTRGNGPGRLIKFDFQESTPYQLEFTAGFLRFWAGNQRATNNDGQAVVGVSAANPAVVQVAQAVTWQTGQFAFFTNLGLSAPLLQNRLFIITKIDTTHFSLADAITGANTNGATLGWTSGGTMNVVEELATPYPGNAWAKVRPVQAGIQMVLLNGARPQVLTVASLPGPAAFAKFALNPAVFNDGPYLDPFPDSVATPGGFQGNIVFTIAFQQWLATTSYSQNDYVTNAGAHYKSLQNANLNNTPATSPLFWKPVTAGDPFNPNGFVPSDVGRLVRMFSEPPLWVATTAYIKGQVVTYNDGFADVYFVALAPTTGIIPGSDAVSWAVSANVAIWTWGRITAITAASIINPATGAAIGNMTIGGGLPAAFDGNTNKAIAACAEAGLGGGGAAGFLVTVPPTATESGYVGKNYGGSPQQIAQATCYPSNGNGFTNQLGPGVNWTSQVVINLRAKQTAPATASDGILLGSTGTISDTLSSVSIASNDAVTAYQYVWCELIISFSSGVSQSALLIPNYAQVQFFNPSPSNGDSCTVQIAGPALLYTSQMRTWRLGAYSDTTGWPKCGCYHEGRLWLSGAINNRLDASQPVSASDPLGSFSFSPTEIDGTVDGASGIDYTLNSEDVNAIFWMIPDAQGILCGTQAGEWLAQATNQNLPITALSMQAHRYTKIKCANIEPRKTDHTTVFVQANQRRLHEYFADFFSGRFSGPNLSAKARHLMKSGIAEIGYQQDLTPVVWCRMMDGTLRGLSYKRDVLLGREPPAMAGWHQHPLGTSRQVTSISVGPNATGTLDALSMVTTDGTNYFVEMMEDFADETVGLANMQFLDGAVPASAYVDLGNGGITIYGLWDLNGTTATVFAGGLDCGDFAIANGQVFVPYGDGIAAGPGEGLFTAVFVQAFFGAMPIFVGSCFTSQGQIVRADHPQETGTRNGPGFAKVKRTHKFGIQLVNARKVSVGTLFTALQPITPTDNGSNILPATETFTGIWKDSFDDRSENFDSMLGWQIVRPFQALVARVGGFIETQDE